MDPDMRLVPGAHRATALVGGESTQTFRHQSCERTISIETGCKRESAYSPALAVIVALMMVCVKAVTQEASRFHLLTLVESIELGRRS